IGYADAFFDFIEKHVRLFPEEYKRHVLMDEARRIAYMYVYAANQQDAIKNAANDDDRRNAFAEYLLSVTERVDDAPLPQQIAQDDIDIALREFTEPLSQQLNDLGPIDAAELAAVAIKGLFKHFPGIKNATGIVVAGYGEDDFFPG